MRQVDPPSDHVRSVARALRLLEEIGDHPEGISAKRLASRCEIKLATVYHLLRTLRYEGYLERLPSGDYVLGLAIAERFRELVGALAHPPPVRAVMRRLAGDTGHSTYLARFVEGRVTITQVVEAPGSPPLEDLMVGFNDGAHATALGKALLSTLPRRRRRGYLAAAGLRPFTPVTVTDTDVLEHEIAACAPQRLFTESEQYRRDVGCAAALVHTSDDEDRWWALGISFGVERIPSLHHRIITPLQIAAGDLGAA
jgi:DNA-binding IclR family transcriptional regulator